MCALLVIVMIVPACTKNFEETNTNPNNVPVALPQQLLGPALVETLRANMVRNRGFNNELMQVTVSISDGDASVFRYEYRNTLSDYLWNSWYIQLTNFKDIYAISAETEGDVNASYQGISLISQAWIYSMLTDTYGDIPYFESNKAKEGIYEPKFDQQKEVYMDLFNKLEEANTLLKLNKSIVGESDPVFNGNISRWRKLGNSLYLRLLLRIADKPEVSDEVIAKIKKIVNEEASSYPMMSSNEDSAILRWTGVGAYTSPFVTNVRAQDFRAPAIASFFIDHLRDWADPRLDISTYGKNGVNRWGITQGSNGFSGVTSGYVPGTGVAKNSYFYSYDQNNESLQNDPITGMIMNYAELQFILAELAAKGWINGSAENFYYSGVLNSITQWLPIWPNPTATTTPTTPAKITDPEFINYVMNAELVWDDSLPLDAETGTSKMEKIHLQKYYALFLTDMQQWFEYRRTGHPILPKGLGLRNDGIMPARMVYPVYIQSANPTNYKIAVASQGADAINTEVWWQKP